MPVAVPTQVGRKRRVHKKSRKGCANCKLRGVKCDEGRPQCKKCRLYGVDCNYGGTVTSLQLSSQSAFQVDFAPLAYPEQVVVIRADIPSARATRRNLVPAESIPSPSVSLVNGETADHRGEPGMSTLPNYASIYGHLSPQTPVSFNASMVSMIDGCIQSGFSERDLPWDSPKPFWHFTDAHYEILFRFQHRTALTIGDKRIAPAYRDCINHLAVSNPFLMHMLLGLTLMHDADLVHSRRPELYASHKLAALQHWNTGSKLFNQLLAKPILPTKRDAIWATGVIIGATSFWYVNSDKVDEVWPLKPSEPDDLAWLRLGEGKKSLWRIADPTRPDSIFYQLMKDKAPHCPSVPAWISTIDTSMMRVPQHIKAIFGVTPTSTFKNNVYHLPLFILSRIQSVRLTHANVLSFIYFTAFITPELMHLLEIKDQRAVFLLGWWFSIIEDGDLWWMSSRAKIEGWAIRLWLERGDDGFGLAGVLDGLRRETRERVVEGWDAPVEIWAHDWDED